MQDLPRIFRLPSPGYASMTGNDVILELLKLYEKIEVYECDIYTTNYLEQIDKD